MVMLCVNVPLNVMCNFERHALLKLLKLSNLSSFIEYVSSFVRLYLHVPKKACRNYTILENGNEVK